MPAETTDHATYDGTSDGEGKWTGPMGPVQGITSKLFASCAQDAKGSVHRAWGITLLFITLFFIMSILEGTFVLFMDEGASFRYYKELELLPLRFSDHALGLRRITRPS